MNEHEVGKDIQRLENRIACLEAKQGEEGKRPGSNGTAPQL